LAIKPHVAGARRQQTQQDARQRGFAAARFAHDCQNLALLDIEMMPLRALRRRLGANNPRDSSKLRVRLRASSSAMSRLPEDAAPGMAPGGAGGRGGGTGRVGKGQRSRKAQPVDAADKRGNDAGNGAERPPGLVRPGTGMQRISPWV
jgi:hypothetical protein